MAHPKEFAEGLSIGIIMDGNGRWAKNRGLPRTAGHKRGAEVFSDIADYCDELGVSSVYFYAFFHRELEASAGRGQRHHAAVRRISAEGPLTTRTAISASSSWATARCWMKSCSS